MDEVAHYSEDCALASKSAAAFAAANVSAVPLAISSSRLRDLALRLTSHVGTPSCVYTSSIKSPTSVQTAGPGHKGGSGCHSMSVMCFPSQRSPHPASGERAG